MEKLIQEILKLIEGMEPIEMEAKLSEEDKLRLSKWVTALVAKVYTKGLQDGKEDQNVR